MKKSIMLSALVFFVFQAGAQILTPVKWSYAAKKTGASKAIVFIKATIDEGWHIYSTHQKEGGPAVTKFTFIPSVSYQLIDKISEPEPVVKYEKVFNMTVMYFEHAVVFEQHIRLGASQAVVKGKLNYMVCNDHQCLPPDELTFSIPVK